MAPAAASSSAFQAQAALPPATIALRSRRSRKTGSRARRPMRCGAISAGLLDGGRVDDPPDIPAAGAATGAGAQSGAHGFDIVATASDRIRNLPVADFEARADQGAAIGHIGPGAAGQQPQAGGGTGKIHPEL